MLQHNACVRTSLRPLRLLLVRYYGPTCNVVGGFVGLNSAGPMPTDLYEFCNQRCAFPFLKTRGELWLARGLHLFYSLWPRRLEDRTAPAFVLHDIPAAQGISPPAPWPSPPCPFRPLSGPTGTVPRHLR